MIMIVKSDYLKLLKLSKNEKAVFDVLEARQMAGTVSRIAREAGIPRTTTLYTLKKLAELKLAKKISRGKRDHWMKNRMLK